MSSKRKIPHQSHTFLHRQGLRIIPSQNFVDKFKEFYLEELHKNKIRSDRTISNDEARHFAMSFFEAIIYCLDFGIDINFFNIVKFKVILTDFKSQSKNVEKLFYEDMKKITFTLSSSCKNKMRKELNKDNEDYNKYLELKEKHYKEIKRYYRDFYGKEGEWWTYD